MGRDVSERRGFASPRVGIFRSFFHSVCLYETQLRFLVSTGAPMRWESKQDVGESRREEFECAWPPLICSHQSRTTLRRQTAFEGSLQLSDTGLTSPSPLLQLYRPPFGAASFNARLMLCHGIERVYCVERVPVVFLKTGWLLGSKLDVRSRRGALGRRERELLAASSAERAQRAVGIGDGGFTETEETKVPQSSCGETDDGEGHEGADDTGGGLKTGAEGQEMEVSRLSTMKRRFSVIAHI